MSKSKRSNHIVTENFVFFAYDALDGTQLFEALMSLNPSVSGAEPLGTFSGQLANFFDMYRLARLDDIKIEALMGASPGTQSSYYAWFLAYLPPDAAAPSNLLSIETKHCSEVCSGNAANANNRAKLHMTRRDLPPLAEAGGPGPGWLATNDDGPETSWGTIYVINGSPAGTAAPELTWKVTLTMSFCELVDPTLLSARFKARSQLPERPLKSLRAPPRQDPEEEDLTMSRLKAQLKALSSK